MWQQHSNTNGLTGTACCCACCLAAANRSNTTETIRMMKNIPLLSVLTTALLAGASVPAAAQQKLLPAQSELVFVAKQMGVKHEVPKLMAWLLVPSASPAVATFRQRLLPLS